MDEPFPHWPALLFNLVLPSRSKYFLLNLWIADTHTMAPSLLAQKIKDGILNGVVG
jgi:hypothetical protein